MPIRLPVAHATPRSESSARALFGRERELAVIETLLDEVRDRGSALLIRGEAGIGKSSLMAVATASARSRGFRVLAAWGAQSETDLPFAGLHQLLRPILDWLDQLPPPQRLALQSAFGTVNSAAPEPFIIALATLNLIAEAATAEPILIVVEEANALDRPTIDALGFVARRLESDPIVLLAALRDGLPSTLENAGLPELRLEGLDQAASQLILEESAPELAEPVRQRLVKESLGNPLALVELSTTLEPRQVRGEMELPERLRLTRRLEQSYASRLATLSPAARWLLLLAAADDRGIVADVLEAPARDGHETVSVRTLDGAVAVGLIEIDGPTFRFRHPLVRSAIYQSASDEDRRAAHASLAAVLGDDPDRRVLHLAVATIGPDESVAADLETAADRAQRRGGMDVAVSLLERAANLSPGSEARLGRRLRAAEMAFELGRRDQAGRILENIDAATVSRRDRARILWIREVSDPADAGHLERMRTLIEAAEDVIELGEMDLALNLLWTSQLRTWRTQVGPELRRRLITVTESVPVADDDPRVLAILAAAAPIERGEIVLERLRRKDPASEADPAAQRFLGMAATTIGDFVLAEAFLARAVAALRAQGRLAVLAQALNLHAWAAIHTRSLDLAAAHAEEGGRLARETRQLLWSAGTDVTLVHVAGMRGTEEDADALAGRVEAALSPTQGGDVRADLQMARGVAALCRRRHAEAYAHLQRIYDRSDPAFHPGHKMWAIGDFIEAAVLGGHARDVVPIMEEMEALSRVTPSPRFQLAMARARPWLADEADVDALYTNATAAADLARWPFIRGRTHLAYGEWLRRGRHVADARDQLRVARDVFDTYGAVHWADRARGELRAAGEVSHRRSPDAFDQLTPQELQIARLAAKGLSNREIGEQLYLSHRTIGFHLYHVFPKLAITSRAELATALVTSADTA